MTQQTTTTHINSITIVKTSYGKVWLTQDDDKIVLLDEEAKELASHIKKTNITTSQTTTTHINDLIVDKTQFGNTWITQAEDKIVLSNKEAKRVANHLEEINSMTTQTSRVANTRTPDAPILIKRTPRLLIIICKDKTIEEA